MVSTALSHPHTQSKSSNSLRTTLSQSPWAQTLREISNVCLPVTLCPIVLYWFFFWPVSSSGGFFSLFFSFPFVGKQTKSLRRNSSTFRKVNKSPSIGTKKRKLLLLCTRLLCFHYSLTPIRVRNINK